MEVEIIYPTVKMRQFVKVVDIIKWCFIAAAYIGPIINIYIGGKPWSVIMLWGLWYVWSLFISRDLIEYNRISQSAKILVNSCITLVLIELFLSSGWAAFVIPLVAFGTLIVIGVLFFSNLSKQRQNVMPMVWLIAGSIAALIGSLIGWPEMNWPMIVLGLTAFTLLVTIIAVLKRDLLREFKKRFHTL